MPNCTHTHTHAHFSCTHERTACDNISLPQWLRLGPKESENVEKLMKLMLVWWKQNPKTIFICPESIFYWFTHQKKKKRKTRKKSHQFECPCHRFCHTLHVHGVSASSGLGQGVRSAYHKHFYETSVHSLWLSALTNRAYHQSLMLFAHRLLSTGHRYSTRRQQKTDKGFSLSCYSRFARYGMWRLGWGRGSWSRITFSPSPVAMEPPAKCSSPVVAVLTLSMHLLMLESITIKMLARLWWSIDAAFVSNRAVNVASVHRNG